MSNKTGKRKNHVWDYFAKVGESARCSMCNKILKVSQRSIKGLKCHLKSKHGIYVISPRTPAPIKEVKSSASIDDSLKMGDHQGDIEDLSTPIPIKKIKIRNSSDNIDSAKEHRSRKKGVWKYFTKTGENGRCSLCNNILKISQRSTTGLKCHLKSIHGIDIVTSSTPAPVQQLEPSTSKDDSTINKEAKISNSTDTYVTKEYSKELMISRLVAKDRLTFESLSASEDLKYLFLKSGFSLPTDTNIIKLIVENFAQTVRAEMSKKIENLKIHGGKFSMIFNEWSSTKNKRYLNVNVHYSGAYFNLGLIRIHDSCNAEDYIKLIKTRLELFGLHLDTDIIGITTDHTSVMKKVNSLISCYKQFCFAHAIQLAVVETLYNAPSNESYFIKDEEVDPLGCSDDDNDPFDEETSEEQLMSVTYVEKSAVQLIPDYRYLINKIRQTVKIFRNSLTKYAYLQKYMGKYLEKESNLILDSKISWSSLFNMLERFYVLRGCISKALIDVGSEIKFSDQEWAKVKELTLCLEPLKLGVEVLCRRDSTLLTADTTLKFILNKLDKLEGEVSTDLAIALRMRIKKRRTDLSGICIYLHNPKKYENCLEVQDNIFSVPKKSCIRLEIQKICERMLPMTWNVDLDHTIIKSENIADQEITINRNLSLQEELEMQLNKETRNASNVNMMAEKNIHFEKNIKIEMAEFESSGIRGKYLSLVHNYLNTITPTSIEAEKAFSVTGYICSPIRRGLPDKTIDAISFLRSYFQNEP